MTATEQQAHEWRDVLVPCESCGRRVGEWCKHVQPNTAAIHRLVSDTNEPPPPHPGRAFANLLDRIPDGSSEPPPTKAPATASEPQAVPPDRDDSFARGIIKRISDAALELAFTRHSLTSDEVDCDDGATIKKQVAATEALCEEVKEDTFNVLVGDETGCLDEFELDETNCELIWLQSRLAATTALAEALMPHSVFLLLDEFEDAQGADYHIGKKRQLAEFIAAALARWEGKGQSE